MRLRVIVPATSANLGPGFDCFGLALDLCNEVEIDTESPASVSWEGSGAAELPTDGTDLCGRAMAQIAHEAGRPMSPLARRGTNRIPMERGLGSSSSAAVAGVAIAARLLELSELSSPEAMARAATRIEGHPDNVAAAVHGGLTLATADGTAVRLDPHPSLRPVALVPEHVRLSTAEARARLGATVPRGDAVFNAAHAALAVVALTERPELLGTALRDRLHQDARLELVPEVRTLFEEIASAGVPVVVSGAGPTLLAFETEEVTLPDPGPGWSILRLSSRRVGVEIHEL